MRQIGTLRKESDALRLVDYLFTEGIRAHAEADRDDWVIWVRDENDLDRGRDELENFSRSPDDARYARAAAKADSIRKEEILRLCLDNRVPCVPVLTFDEVLSNSQLNSRDYFQEIGHPEAGDFRYPGPPYRLSASPPRVVRAAPTLGQHNREILCDELGLAASEYASLSQAGVV